VSMSTTRHGVIDCSSYAGQSGLIVHRYHPFFSQSHVSHGFISVRADSVVCVDL